MSHDIPSGPHLLPVRGLNEIFIGESLSSRYCIWFDGVTPLWNYSPAFYFCKHLINRISSVTPCIPPSAFTCESLFATGWSINPSNLILPSRFIGLRTMKSLLTTGRGISRRAQDLAFALELGLKHGASEQCLTEQSSSHFWALFTPGFKSNCIIWCKK